MGENWDAEFDVIVVGSGGPGMTAAVAAAAHGLRTEVLEATNYLGGTSAYSGAGLNLPGNEVLERHGIETGTDQVKRYLNELLGDYKLDERNAWVDTARELVSFLEAQEDIEFTKLYFPDYFDRPGRAVPGRAINPEPLPASALGEWLTKIRPPMGDDRAGRTLDADATLDGGRSLIGRLTLAAARNGAEIRTEHKVTGLITEGDQVIGVTVDTPDGPQRHKAERGVIAANGGFEANAELRALHGVPGDAKWTFGPVGANQGAVLSAAVELGAATELLDQAWFAPAVENPDGMHSPVFCVFGGFFVDANGKRFTNECLPYDQLGRLLHQLDDAQWPTWWIFDSRIGANLPAAVLPKYDVEEHLSAGTWVKADSIAELAEATGLPADALSDTTETFSAGAAEGTDAQFNRGADPFDTFFAPDMGFPNKALVPLDQPPFYATRLIAADLGTKGGLSTNKDGQVLRADGSVLPGLFAIGNTTANVSRDVYPGPGTPIGTGMVFGYRAVKSLL